ncbi:MAG: C10 family peptidase [Kiritimatiellae bacterium]|nr:C10 family peptidase [Kiritimatiellia bacterium]
MRNKFVVSVVACMAVFRMFAVPVSMDEATTAVANWLASGQAMGYAGMGDVADVQAYDGKEGVGKFYVISLKDGAGAAAGYVVTSADRKLNPVLAYSDNGTFAATTENPLWVMLTIDVSAATRAMEVADPAGTATGGRGLASAAPETENEKKWAELLDGRQLKGTSRSSINDVRVDTLMETKWGQSGHGENQYTPHGYVCGCVATAGAQIMRYWKYPTASISAIKSYYGTAGDTNIYWNLTEGYQTTAGGTYTPWNDDVKTFGGTYDWNNMPATVSRGVSDTQKKAIGKLTLDVGRSVHMSYASDGSGAHYGLFATRLTDQFQYKNAAVIITNNGLSLEQIKKAILPSLDLKSPCGVSVPGHAIVADGYGYNSGTLYGCKEFFLHGSRSDADDLPQVP